MSSSKIQTRNYKLKREDAFAFRNTCVVKTLRVERARNLLHLRLVINEVKLEPTKKAHDHFIFDVPTIRQQIRELEPFGPANSLLLSLEDALVYNQMNASSFYKTLSKDELYTILFTKDMAVQFELTVKADVSELEVTETSYMSDTQLEAKEKEAKEKEANASN